MSAPIATADEILKYLQEVLEEHELEQHINFGQKVVDRKLVF